MSAHGGDENVMSDLLGTLSHRVGGYSGQPDQGMVPAVRQK